LLGQSLSGFTVCLPLLSSILHESLLRSVQDFRVNASCPKPNTLKQIVW
jgi:hypothetical protein